MANTPNIRFKGFTGEWEQRKLEEIVDYVDYRGKTPTKTDSGVFLVTAKNVKDGYIDYEISQEYISEDNYDEVMHRGKPEIGDVLITTEAPCGNVAQVNKADIALAQRIIKYRGHSNALDNTYLKHYLLSPEFQRVLKAKSSGGTVQGIKGSILHQQEIKYPTYKEQVKIGQHLNTLDLLITLHQHKFDETKELKKYMLKKMFPQNGKKIPEIRFAGFTNNWERRKVLDVANRFDNFRVPVAASLRVPGITPYYGANGVQGYVDGFTHDGEFVLVAEDGAYDLKNYPVKCVNGRIWVNNHAHVLQGKPEMADNKFLAYSISQADIEPLLVGGARVKLNAEIMMGIEFYIPSIDEQRVIGKYLTHLDNLIALHQRKCDELKQIKKYMLQNMFPQKG